jgi:hypothetical protein
MKIQAKHKVDPTQTCQPWDKKIKFFAKLTFFHAGQREKKFFVPTTLVQKNLLNKLYSYTF